MSLDGNDMPVPSDPTCPHDRPGASFPIVELRQYTLHDGQRDTLIDLFEREFVESQEAVGMKVIGTFRDLDHPDRFVWLRGFSDMDARLAGLSQFYGGPVWQANRDEANATMIDSDNVLLLHAPGPAAEFAIDLDRAAPREGLHGGLVVASIHHLKPDVGPAGDLFEHQVKARLERGGVPVLAWFVPEARENNFPRLPVRDAGNLLVWFAAFSGPGEFEAHRASILEATAPLRELSAGDAEILRLEPTARSRLRGSGVPAKSRRHDFDFLLGRWAVAHRKLALRGVGGSDWQTYEGTAETRALLGGSCNVEEHRIAGSDSSGVALRCFDEAAGRWAIYWVSERDGRLQPPVHGSFVGDEGLFEGDDEDEGRPVKVRFLWRRLGPDSATWEQAFSYDGGRSWETNWTMQFERAAA